jgi:transcription elongation factor GreA
LEDIISRAQVIDASQLSGDTVRFGATVLLADEDTDDEITYKIVGAHEADIKKGLLSVHAPLARALIGKKLGNTVEVTTPSGSKSYEIVDVRFE